MDNEFATFTPVKLNSTPSKEEIAKYYNDNNIIMDNEYLNNFLGLGSVTATPKTPIKQPKTIQKTYNISEILGGMMKPAVSTSVEAINKPFVTTNKPKSPSEFLQTYDPSVENASKQLGIPKDLLLAQIALETGWGEHTPGNNIGGIKADANWTGKKRYSLTTEYDPKKGYYKDTLPFRVYDTLQEGMKGYADFLSQNKRYKSVMGITDAYKAADAMAKTGYATDKNYGAKLKNVIKQIEQFRIKP